MKIHCIALLLLSSTLALTGCRSSKNATTEAADTSAVQTVAPVQQTRTWQNVYLPVKMELLQPQKFSISGRATMVADKYMLISLRFFGMEVGQVYVDNSNATIVLRQPQKICMEQPVAAAMSTLGVSLADLQDALLGNEAVLAKLPSQFVANSSVTSDGDSSQIILTATNGEKQYAVRITSDLKSAEWNVKSPRTFTAPGSEYQRVTLQSALKIIDSL